MLPVEILSDIVALFKYFDLGSLLLTNKQFSDVALQFTNAICVQDFSEFHFTLATDSTCFVYRRSASPDDDAVFLERFADVAEMSEFISKAFRHCVIGNLRVTLCSERVLRAIQEAASTVVVTGTLSIEVSIEEDELSSEAEQEAIDFVGTFGRVR
ncbi:hypothetical protein AAVH_38939, partial [Aphelenchoides avenae]